MAKFVLAGRADCPYYAKAELLADYLQKNLPDFRIHKITQHPDVWELYYGVTSSMTTELMKSIAQENLGTHIEKELEEESLKGLVNPLQVWITSASSLACYHLIPILTSGEVFGPQMEISINLFDSKHTEEKLISHKQEAEDLASPYLQSVSICTQAEEAFHGAHVIIILDDHMDKEIYSLEDCIRSRAPLCQLYGSLIEKNAHNFAKIIVGGKTFVNLKTALLMKYAPTFARNIIAVALGVEGQAKAALARKLKITPSCIKDVIIWGNISGNNYVDLRKAKVYRYESAIWGPPHYSRPVLSLLFDRDWVNREFVASLKTLTATGRQFGGMLAAHSIATTLKYWCHGSPPGEIVSLGVLSEGQFGIPKGIVFSMPVKFENGTWVVLTDLKNTEISQQVMTRMANDLIQEQLVALGELANFQPCQSETDLNQDVETTLPTKNDHQGLRKVSDDYKDLFTHLMPDDEKDLILSDGDFGLSEHLVVIVPQLQGPSSQLSFQEIPKMDPDKQDALNSIENSAYRTAFKLQSVQTLCQYDAVFPLLPAVDLIGSSLIQHVLLRQSLWEAGESTLSVQQLFQALQEMFQKVRVEKPGQVHPRASELTLSLLTTMYDSTGTGFIKLAPAAAALITLSGDSPLTKYREIIQTPVVLTLLKQSLLPSPVTKLMVFVIDVLNDQKLEIFQLSLGKVVPCALWRVLHAAVSKGYRCLKCLNFDICQVCFLSSLQGESHQKSHPVVENCIQCNRSEVPMYECTTEPVETATTEIFKQMPQRPSRAQQTNGSNPHHQEYRLNSNQRLIFSISCFSRPYSALGMNCGVPTNPLMLSIETEDLQSSVNLDLYCGAERVCKAFSALIDQITLTNLK
ncbi:hypothetical protein MG293_004641 [Ovis ammon polii]|uniref:Putative malate dehydrogenase 1B n=1 Tax=Ovis ammon polii TaxID=230172 RepID=A0AAD4YAZ4_OVIAM|nr:hypothetical protein MG293_004641 [Ovis ammon polii]